jgi:hypothetical protein
MAITLDQANLGTNKANAGSSTIITTSAAAASGSIIILSTGRFNASTTVTLSATSSPALTWTVAKDSGAATRRAYIIYAVAASGLASGSTITVSASAGSTDIMAGASSFLGVDSVTPLSGTGSSGTNSATTAWSATATTFTTGAMLFGVGFCDGSGTSSTPAVGLTEAIDFNSAASPTESVTSAYKIAATTGDTISGTWLASTTSACCAIGFAVAGGGGTTVKNLAALGVG